MATIGFLVLFFGLLAAGMPIFLVLGACAAVLYFVSGQPMIGVAQNMIDQLNSTTLMALPLFVMAAAFMRRGGVAQALVDLSAAWLGGMQGLARAWWPWCPARCSRRSPARRWRPRWRWAPSCCRR